MTTGWIAPYQYLIASLQKGLDSLIDNHTPFTEPEEEQRIIDELIESHRLVRL
jgi:hypothetical protein